MKNAWESVKRKWEDDPLYVITVGASVAIAAVSGYSMWSQASSRRAYARVMNNSLKNRTV